MRRRDRARLAAAGAGLAIGLAVGTWPMLSERRDVTAAAPPIAVTSGRGTTVVGSFTAPAPGHALALPPGPSDAELRVMPDRYVNEPLPASFRVVITVRGTRALGSLEPPATITWTEGGLSYQLSSRFQTIAQLVDIAGALR